ncbi:MAG: divalent-cation tolerance protein CutA [Planctomycetaceae bacterium]|nr:divalent-cation tolerance protein CutA [Planctomycetaceae bacterium]
MTDVLIVQTTTPTVDEAEKIAEVLLDQKLAACIQIHGPVTSHYVWQGIRERSTEWVCCIKTTSAAYAQVEKVIRTGHTYDEPEIIACPVTHGSAGYLKWLSESVASATNSSS